MSSPSARSAESVPGALGAISRKRRAAGISSGVDRFAVLALSEDAADNGDAALGLMGDQGQRRGDSPGMAWALVEVVIVCLPFDFGLRRWTIRPATTPGGRRAGVRLPSHCSQGGRAGSCRRAAALADGADRQSRDAPRAEPDRTWRCDPALRARAVGALSIRARRVSIDVMTAVPSSRFTLHKGETWNERRVRE